MSQVSFLHFGLSGILSSKKVRDVVTSYWPMSGILTFPLKHIDFTNILLKCVLSIPGVAFQCVDQELMEINPSWIGVVLTGI